ncbi:hypothetical protein KBB12_00270 [Candidatus Woesebacteria bacterium]|nr:hypothetical protein [Candidatus Woesebacteria bacterium]
MPSQTIKSHQPIKVGFDLDGVLFFNPLRFVRGPLDLIKKGGTLQYIPKTRLEQFLWRILHMSSFTPASGWQTIRTLTRAKLIEPYVITARFKCLQKDFEKCMRVVDAPDYFVGCYQNLNDEQPHKYKERMIKELNLEYYVEDNWNIVEHLTKTTSAQILWVSNLFDADIQFDRRFNNLAEALQELETITKQPHRV